jgi:hypothetical protein
MLRMDYLFGTGVLKIGMVIMTFDYIILPGQVEPHEGY